MCLNLYLLAGVTFCWRKQLLCALMCLLSSCGASCNLKNRSLAICTPGSSGRSVFVCNAMHHNNHKTGCLACIIPIVGTMSAVSACYFYVLPKYASASPAREAYAWGVGLAEQCWRHMDCWVCNGSSSAIAHLSPHKRGMHASYHLATQMCRLLVQNFFALAAFSES